MSEAFYRGIEKYGSYFSMQNYPGKRIAVVGLISGDEILTGKRRDNGKWTFTAGHVDKGEGVEEAAIREVFEESGITINTTDLFPVKSGFVGEMAIFAFTAKVYKEKTSLKYDPDKEVSVWKWVKIDTETPELKRENRHAKNDYICDILFRRS